MKINVLIVEDEAASEKILRFMLSSYFDNIEVLPSATGVKQGFDYINRYQPDIIFLDIKLSDGDGFDLLEKFKKIDFGIIFTTAYNEYAIKAFKYSTIDYLLKPINPVDLKIALNKAQEIKKDKERYYKILQLLKNYTDDNKIILNTLEGKEVCPVHEIIRLEADGAYTIFVLEDKKITVSKNIKFYEKSLDEKTFIRTHQSHLVNIQHIQAMESPGTLILSNGDKIPISVRKRSFVKSLFKNNK